MATDLKTFALQEKLPSLPVPSLDQTLEKYLESARQLLNDAEYAETCKIVENFRVKDGQILQKELENRAKTSRNWVEKWWEDGYHELRFPIYPLVNIGAASPNYDIWPPKIGTQLERAALTIFQVMQSWQRTREERLPIMFIRKTPWCMSQVRRIFNSCRIPGEHKDHIKCYFRTKSEGSCPSHLVIICRGRLWKLPMLDKNGDIFTPPQIEKALTEIQINSQSRGPSVCALTAWDRTSWFQAREHLIALDSQNEDILETIQSAVAVACLTDESPVRKSEMAKYGVAGDARNIFADKNVTWHFHKNGLFTFSAEHSIADGIVGMQLSDFVEKELEKIAYKWPESVDLNSIECPVFEELRFVVDDKILSDIEEAIHLFESISSDLEIKAFHFKQFANGFFRQNMLYGDTVVQVALQLAYHRMYGKPAPTYETASTRKFYHGRTETIRSCTKEATEFAKTVLDGKTSQKERYDKFLEAMDKQNRSLLEAMEGQGIDRHLFGLRCVAKEVGMDDPLMFQDEGWQKTGGDGNFILSTSFIGYATVFGGVAPMCLDGYGCFYKMTNEKITFFLSKWKSSQLTNLDQWKENIGWSLMQIHDLFTRNSAKL